MQRLAYAIIGFSLTCLEHRSSSLFSKIKDMDGAVLLRRDDHSNDLIVHFLNQVSRLLDCDSAQDRVALEAKRISK